MFYNHISIKQLIIVHEMYKVRCNFKQLHFIINFFPYFPNIIHCNSDYVLIKINNK